MSLKNFIHKTKPGLIMLVSLVIIGLSVQPTKADAWWISQNTTLQSDFYGTIIFNKDEITLDLNGYSIIGNGTNSGVIIQDRYRATVSGPGTIVGHRYGIELDHNERCVIEYIDIQDCYRGIYCHSDDYKTEINECSMYNNDYGIQFNGAHYQYITNSQTYQNNVDGVDIDNSTMLDIAQLRSVMNNEIGCDIEPGYTTELNGMYDCDFNYNGNTGLRLIRCVLNLYNWDCRMNNNGRYGLYLYWGSDYNRFYNCSGVGNGRSNKNDRGYRNYFDNNCYFP